jgi:hypothetical protein
VEVHEGVISNYPIDFGGSKRLARSRIDISSRRSPCWWRTRKASDIGWGKILRKASSPRVG